MIIKKGERMIVFKNTYILDLDILDTQTKYIPNFRLGLMIKQLSESVRADGLNPDRMDEHDEFFIPRDKREERLWQSLRVEAKVQMHRHIKNRINGNWGGKRIKGQKKS